MKTLGLLTLIASGLSSVAQPVSLNVQQTNGQIAVSWPAGLSLVQLQKRTNLALGAWQDYGAATTASKLPQTFDSTYSVLARIL
jgi:hypothetical protein